MTGPEGAAIGPTRSTRDRVVAIVTVPTWYAVLYVGFVGLVAWQTRTGVDGWEGLILFAAIAYGALAFVLSSTIGIVVMGLRARSARWRAGPILSGTVAAVIGLAGCLLVPATIRLLDLLLTA